MATKIYEISSKYGFSEWSHTIYVFLSQEAAKKWLNTEEYDFRERELMTKSAASKLIGRKAVDQARAVV